MPRLTDLARVRARLDRDPAWSAYAMGDLSPAFAHFAEWYHSPDDEAVMLVYREFAQPIVFAIGPPERIAPLFAEIEADAIILQLQPDVIPWLAPRFVVEVTHPMWRMQLDVAAFSPPDLDGVEPLTRADVEAIRALYADGDAAGEAPDFFSPSMLDAGLFFGIRERAVLVAAAGTHIAAPDMGICAIGNVYTRRDRRSCGYGLRVTAAVTAGALARGVETIVLNVRHRNAAARRVYERLGFVARVDFCEGFARRSLADPATPDR